MVLRCVDVLWVRQYEFQARVENEFRDKPARAKSNSLIEVSIAAPYSIIVPSVKKNTRK